MDLQNDSCENNITDIKLQALTTGLPGIACFILNLVGLTAELIFVCKRKNTFLLRLYLYLSVAVTISVGVFSSFILIYFWSESEVLCSIIQISQCYTTIVELLVIFSISIILLYKLGSSCRLSQHKTVMVERPSQSSQKCFEFVLVFLNFSIPAAIILPVMVVMEVKSRVCFLNIKASFSCYIEKELFFEAILIFEMTAVILNVFLYLLCICVLLVWLCCLRSKHLLKARMKTVIKEVGTLLVVLVTYCVLAVLTELIALFERTGFYDSTVGKFVLYMYSPLFPSCLPIAFFVYICICVCPQRKKTAACYQVKRRRTGIQTAGLQTAPPSTRVSLPSDTAEHAPNFLSPSGGDTSEVSPLLA